MKTYLSYIFIIIICCCSANLAYSQSLADNPCSYPAAAQWPLDGVCYATSTAGMTPLYNPGTCFAGNRDDGWAWFVGDGNNITVVYTPNSNDATMHVFAETAPCTVSEIGCSDVCCGGATETVTITPSVSGQIYFVRVQRYNSNNTMLGCLSVTSSGGGGGGGAGDDCANADRIDCGDPILVGETTVGNTDTENAWACHAPIATPGEDHFYVVQWTDAAAGGTIRLNFTNVSDANDTYMEVMALGNSCSPNACDASGQLTIATGLFGTATNFLEYDVPAGVTDYYFVVDAQNDGIDSYDLEVTCFTTGIELDQTSSCAPIPGGEPANQGYYQTWDGAAPPATADPASMTGTYTICENLYLKNVGWEWLKYFDITLGDCWTNPTNFSPNGVNTGFHSMGHASCSGNPGGLTGHWSASLAGNVISWSYIHPWRRNPPCVDVTSWGDGNQLFNNYTCALYTFCYDANVDPACNELTGFQNGISATDDGIGGGGGGAINPSNITLGTTSPTVLPVNLISFTAEAVIENEKYGVVLKWKTASEKNNDYFTVERSVDGVNFEEVFRMKGAGNSNDFNNYFGVDEAPYKGISYYRLKQTDFNGDFEHFKMVSVQVSSIGAIEMYPNPVKSELNISLESKKENAAIYIKIYNIQGKLIFSESKELQKGINNAVLAMDDFTQGVYFITVENEGQIEKMKFFKE